MANNTYQFGGGFIVKIEDPDPVEADIINPGEYMLAQNYPNPFNPTTSIDFVLPGSKLVNLTVYNSLGQEVSVLVNGELAAGHHSAEFSAKGGSASGGNAYNLPSGVYFYQLKAGEYTSVKKMILLR